MSDKKSFFNKDLKKLLVVIEQEMGQLEGDDTVSLFYQPIHYTIALPGKRIRPLLTVLSAEAVGGQFGDALYPAVAVELLHNFTLVHDDVMDNDDTRRGQPTVHKKWDISTAILAGDGLMGLAFRKLLQTSHGNIQQMAQRFTETMIVICEGQGLDKMFEGDSTVSAKAYLDMIGRKTAVLLELACELGGMAGNCSQQQLKRLREFGYALGMAFQVQDDLLDIMAEENTLGKKVGSDLALRKQTILTITLREQLGNEDFYNLELRAFRDLLKESGVLDTVNTLYQSYLKTAYGCLQQLPHNEASRKLQQLTDSINRRTW